MTDDWVKTTLGKVLELKRGYDLPKRLRNPGNVPVVSSSGINDYHAEAKVKGPGVVTGRYGTIGEVYYIEEDFWPHNTTLYVRDFKGNHPRFVSYFLQTINYSAFSDKAAVPGVNRNHLHMAKIIFPPVEEQKAISAVLSAFDDKIELNRQMNATLEEIARALFKSWFVDFDPVRRNAADSPSQPYDHLFPGALVVDENGREVPEGWCVGTLGEIAKNPRRSIKPEETNPKTPYIGLQHMPQQSIALSEWGTAEEVSSNKYEFKEGEFLFGKLRPYFHKVGVAPVNGVSSTDILTIIPKNDVWYGLVLVVISSAEFIDYTTAVSTGTRMPRTNWKNMSQFEITIPSNKVATVFNNQVEPLVSKIQNNIFESLTLSELRDTLLPRLMSGQLRVPSI